MTFDETPPKALRWLDTDAARALTTALSIVALIGAILLGVRQQHYISCVADQQRIAAVRTLAIAKATDAERAAQRRLLVEINASNGPELRAEVLAAYDETDRVRAANRPPAAKRC
jgi:hypothetical protein